MESALLLAGRLALTGWQAGLKKVQKCSKRFKEVAERGGSHRTDTGSRKIKQVHCFQTGAVTVQVREGAPSAMTMSMIQSHTDKAAEADRRLWCWGDGGGGEGDEMISNSFAHRLPTLAFR